MIRVRKRLRPVPVVSTATSRPWQPALQANGISDLIEPSHGNSDLLKQSEESTDTLPTSIYFPAV